jgi:hypothetical protein
VVLAPWRLRGSQYNEVVEVMVEMLNATADEVSV